MIALAALSLILAQAPAPQDLPFEISGKGYRLEVTPFSAPQSVSAGKTGGLTQNSANQAAQTASRRYRVVGVIDGEPIDEVATGRTMTDIAGLTSLTTVTQFESSSGVRFQVRNPVPGRTVTQQILNAPVFMPDLISMQNWAMSRYRERTLREQNMTRYYRFKNEGEMKAFLGQNGSRIRAAEKRGAEDPIGEVLAELRAKGYYPPKR